MHVKTWYNKELNKYEPQLLRYSYLWYYCSWELLIKPLRYVQMGQLQKNGGWSSCKISSSIKHHKHYGYASHFSSLSTARSTSAKRIMELLFCTSTSSNHEKSVLSRPCVNKWKSQETFPEFTLFFTFASWIYFSPPSEIKAKGLFFWSQLKFHLLQKKFNM